MYKVLLAEDQSMVREGLKMMIEADERFKVTGLATNGREAISLCETHTFDVFVLDIRMPEMDGLEATRRIMNRWPSSKILILTTFNDDNYALEALKGGAKGYMLKDGEPGMLHCALESCLQGGVSIGDQMLAKIVPKLLREEQNAQVHPDLTPREIEICRQVGEGFSNQEIADTLSLSIGTVKNHISQCFEKLEIRDRTQLAIYAIRHGLV